MITDESTGSKNIEVQRITQKDFDAMSDQKKIFYLDLIKKGQVKISDASDRPAERERRSPFSWLRDKRVRVILTNSEVIEGTLTDVWQYEIALDVPGGSPVLILKHAVMTVQEIP
ncbi:MAG: hypothetical protein WC294_00705 [Methanoregula sp.]|jgi:hypothetical protein